MKVLFFSASIGSGHDQVAHTLAKQMERVSPGIQVQVLDIVKTISPFLSRVMLDSYLALLKYAPGVWGLLHSQFSEPKKLPDPLEFVNNFLSQEVKDRITQFNPDLIVNTYALGSTITGLLRSKKQITAPTATIITDYNLHSYWITKGIDRFYVASKLLQDILIEYGLNKNEVLPLGLPVRKTFLDVKGKDSQEIRLELGLRNIPTILFMGGGLGLGDIISFVKKIDLQLNNSQLIIACGKSKELYHKANQLVTKNALKALPYVENIEQYMKCASIIITKPGGVTLTEAMVLGKPLALISPIPGQESHNEDFLLNQGVAISLPNNKYDGLILANLLKDTKRLQTMSDLQADLVNPNAARDIVEDLFKLIE